MMNSQSNYNQTTSRGDTAQTSSGSSGGSSGTQPVPNETKVSTETKPKHKKLVKPQNSSALCKIPTIFKGSELDISLPDYAQVTEDTIPRDADIPESFKRLARLDNYGFAGETLSPGLAFFVVERSQLERPCFSSTRRRAANFTKHYPDSNVQESALNIMVLETEMDGQSSLAQFVVLDTELLATMARTRVLKAKCPNCEFVLGIVDINEIRSSTYVSMHSLRRRLSLQTPVHTDTRVLVWSHLPNAALKYTMPWKQYSDMLTRERIFAPLVADRDVELQSMNGRGLLDKWVHARLAESSPYEKGQRPAKLFQALWEYMGMHPQDQITKQLVYYLHLICLDRRKLVGSNAALIRATVDRELNDMLMMNQAMEATTTGLCTLTTRDGTFMLTPMGRFNMANFRDLCEMFREHTPFTKGRKGSRVASRNRWALKYPTKLHGVWEEIETETCSGARNDENELQRV